MANSPLPEARAVPPSRYAVFFVIAVVGCAVDLLTKSWIFARIGPPGPDQDVPIVLWPGVFSLTTSLNEGALFGIGQGMTPVFAALSILAAIGIVYWLFVSRAAMDLWLTIALGSITAGIFGNLYDRLGLHGLITFRGGEPERVYAVRDWLHFKIEGVIDWPVFNIADAMLVCGAAMLMWHAVRYEEASAPAATSPANQPSA